MILHPFDPSQFCPFVNKKRLLLVYQIDKLNSNSFGVQDEYWNMCIKEELLSSEEEYKYKEDFED